MLTHVPVPTPTSRRSFPAIFAFFRSWHAPAIGCNYPNGWQRRKSAWQREGRGADARARLPAPHGALGKIHPLAKGPTFRPTSPRTRHRRPAPPICHFVGANLDTLALLLLSSVKRFSEMRKPKIPSIRPEHDKRRDMRVRMNKLNSFREKSVIRLNIFNFGIHDMVTSEQVRDRDAIIIYPKIDERP